MKKRVFILRRSIGAKVLALVVAISIVSFSGLYFANSSMQERIVRGLLGASAKSMAELLFKGMSTPMSVGDNQGTTIFFEETAHDFPLVEIFLTNAKGNITYATRKDTLRKDVAEIYGEQELQDLLDQSRGERDDAHGFLYIQGEPRFVEVKSIKNEPRCYHCHGSKQPLLGSMLVLQDVSAEFDTLMSAKQRGVMISVAGMALLLGVLLWFMQGKVIRRIVSIAAVSDRIGHGDYDQTFSFVGHDELAVLSDNLAKMVEAIKGQLEYNRSVLKGVIVPLIVTDTEGRIESLNDACTKLLGLKEDALKGQKAGANFPAPGINRYYSEKSYHRGRALKGLFTYSRADGVQVPLHYEFTPLEDSTGKAMGVIGVLIDLTQEEADKSRIEEQRKQLLSVVNDVAEAAQSMNDATEEMTGQMEQLTAGVEITTDRTGSVTESIHMMDTATDEVAQRANSVSSTSVEAREVAHKGSAEVRETVKESREVADKTERLAGSLQDLLSKAEDIEQIMSMLNDVADQTNLLALNAAIEAARAGDAGRGFAVVADEVRNLAEKTMVSTREVESRLTAIQQQTRTAVEEMGATREQVIHTAELAGRAGEVLDQVVSQSDDIAAQVDSIVKSSSEQSATSKEVNASADEIYEVSQNLSRQIQDANDSINAVAGMAGRLSELVQKFNIERRRLERMDAESCRYDASCVLISGDEQYNGAVCDISPSGVRCLLTAPPASLHEGNDVTLQIDFKIQNEVVGEITGKVRWIAQRQVGVEFSQELPLRPAELLEMLTGE